MASFISVLLLRSVSEIHFEFLEIKFGLFSVERIPGKQASGSNDLNGISLTLY
jgi:hypothetical protein